MLWLGGPRMNVLATANTVTPSVSADALFPITGAYDGHPSRIFRFGSRTSAPNVTADLELMSGTGGFESWSGGSPVGWTEVNSGTGAVTEEAVVVYEGTRAAALDLSGAGVASIYRDVTVRPGQRLRITSALSSDSAPGGCILRIRNQDTGNYCGSAGVFLPSSQDFQANDILGVGGYQAFSTDITIEAFSVIQKPTTVIRLQIYNEVAASTGYADAVYVSPAYNFVSIHGHNIDYRSAPTFRTSADNFSGAGTLRGTFSVQQPSMYIKLSALCYDRYVRVLFADTNSEASGAIYMGELVVGDASEFRSPALPLQANYLDTQVRVSRRFGAPAVYGMGAHELRSYPMSLRFETVAERIAFMDEWRRTLGGYPVVVVPHSGDSHTDSLYGLPSEDLPHSWSTTTYSTLSMTVEEMMHPLVTG
jgi:hypothetical protein